MTTVNTLEHALTEEEIANPLEALEKLNPDFVRTYTAVKQQNKAAILRSYDQPSYKEEKLIQLLLAQVESAVVTTEEDRIRAEMNKLQAQGHDFEDPVQEKIWEEKLTIARLKDRENQKVNTNSVLVNVGLTSDPTAGLESIKGIGAKSANKLNEVGIHSVSQFEALSYEQKVEILGPLVAEQFKN